MIRKPYRLGISSRVQSVDVEKVRPPIFVTVVQKEYVALSFQTLHEGTKSENKVL